LAIDDDIAVLREPIHGEAGIIVPPQDYLLAMRALRCDHNVLTISDRMQSRPSRTG
jgi:ornithine--oxo-acid transaminase